jgi:hypothetical protein
VNDHVYVTFEYPGGRTATFSSIESNAWDHYYGSSFGTKGRSHARRSRGVPVRGRRPAAGAPTNGVTPKGAGPALEPPSRTADAAGAAGRQRRRPIACGPTAAKSPRSARPSAWAPAACGPERAIHSATACLRADEGRTEARLLIGAQALDRRRGGHAAQLRARHAHRAIEPRPVAHQAGLRLPDAHDAIMHREIARADGS